MSTEQQITLQINHLIHTQSRIHWTKLSAVSLHTVSEAAFIAGRREFQEPILQ